MTDHLTDPDSAKFSDQFVTIKGQSFVAVCGLVNAKNTSGGYAGRAPFYAKLDPTSGKVDALGIEIADVDEMMPDGLNDFCQGDTPDKATQIQFSQFMAGKMLDAMKGMAKDAQKSAADAQSAFDASQ